MGQGQFTTADIGKFRPEDIDKSQASTVPQPPVDRRQAAVVQVESAQRKGDELIGAIKGAGSTAVGLGELVHQIPGVSRATDALYGMPSGSSQAAFGEVRKPLEATNTAQAFGKGAEQMAEFFVPGGILSRGKAAVKGGSTLLNTLFGAGLEGASAGAIGAAQTGSPSAGIKTGLTAGATSAATAPAATGARWLGERIEKALIKAQTVDKKEGFHISNVFKHQLGGTLPQSFEKATEKLQDYSNQLRTQLRLYGPSGQVPKVDIQQALTDTALELGQNQAGNFGSNAGIQSAIQKLMDDPWFQSVANGKADLVTANEIKQAIGELGAWQYGARDPDAMAMEKVANTLYTQLRKSIEAQLPNGPAKVRAINQAMAEIIPVRQAIIRRIPVAERQNVLTLSDNIALGTGTLGLSLANRLLQSGRTANVLNSMANAMPAMGQNTARVAGSLAAMGLNPNGGQ